MAVAACGGSSRPQSTHSTGTASGKAGAALAFAQCMRAHGVTNFPDPKAGSRGIQIQAGSGVNPSSPAFTAAQSACRKLLPGGGPGAGQPSTQAKAAMLAISRCMRRHGISGFPDPTTSPPSGLSGHSAVLGRNGVFLAIPDTIDTRSPAFRQAASACHFPGERPPG